eukprot:1137180-Pelagomonas_calceolata.AAC.5
MARQGKGPCSGSTQHTEGPCARLYSSRTGPSRGTGLGGTVNMGWLALAAAAALSCTSLGGTSTRSSNEALSLLSFTLNSEVLSLMAPPVCKEPTLHVAPSKCA